MTNNKIILDKLLALICSVFDAYSTIFFKLKDDFYYPKAYFSLGDNINPKAKIKSNSGLIGWIIQHQKPLRLNKFDKEETCLGYYQGKEENKIKPLWVAICHITMEYCVLTARKTILLVKRT